MVCKVCFVGHVDGELLCGPWASLCHPMPGARLRQGQQRDAQMSPKTSLLTSSGFVCFHITSTCSALSSMLCHKVALNGKRIHRLSIFDCVLQVWVRGFL